MNNLYFYGHTNKSGPKKVLSNWYPACFKDHEGIVYHNTEQYMMAEKAKLFKDDIMREIILKNPDPKHAKELGRRVKNFDQEVWDLNAKKIVTLGCYYKFSQNDDLKLYLLSTKNRYLVEASKWDKIWGIGISLLEAKRGDKWRGTNWLGECLMEVRKILSKK